MEQIAYRDLIKWLVHMSGRSHVQIAHALGKSDKWVSASIYQHSIPKVDTVARLASLADLSLAFVDKAGNVVASIVPDDAHQGDDTTPSDKPMPSDG